MAVAPFSEDPTLSMATSEQLAGELLKRTEAGLILFAGDGKLEGSKAWGEYYWGPIWSVLGLINMAECSVQGRLITGYQGGDIFPPDEETEGIEEPS